MEGGEEKKEGRLSELFYLEGEEREREEGEKGRARKEDSHHSLSSFSTH